MCAPLALEPASIYPAKYFHVSPTFNAWVKLSIADVCALRAEHPFDAQNIYFHLNHPIRYVRIVGIIVTVEEINERYLVITLDDGSGRTIEARITRMNKTELEMRADSAKANNINSSVENLRIEPSMGSTKVLVLLEPSSISPDKGNGKKLQGSGMPPPPRRTRLDIGSLVRLRCTLSTFRNQRQLILQRVTTLRSTGDEIVAWEELAAFRRDVLSKPWSLSQEQMLQMDADERRARRAEERRILKQKEHDRRKAERRLLRKQKLELLEEKVERKRRKERIIFDAGALI